MNTYTLTFDLEADHSSPSERLGAVDFETLEFVGSTLPKIGCFGGPFTRVHLRLQERRCINIGSSLWEAVGSYYCTHARFGREMTLRAQLTGPMILLGL